MILAEPNRLVVRPGHQSISSQAQAWKSPLEGLTAAQVASWVFDILKPELFSRRKGGHKALGHDRSTTAWLDGLRGWAALSVCIFHVTVEPQWHVGIESCYGAPLPSGGSNTTPAAWPMIRLFWSGGHFAVLVFYTISGYVLPRRLISLLHEGRQIEFIASLHAAICRRPLRLFLPVLWSTLLTLPLSYITGIPIGSIPQKNNVFLDLFTWLRETGKFLYFYRSNDLAHPYNPHTWTIPIELRGSVFVFAWLFVLSQISNKKRLLLTLAMIWYLAFATPGAMYATFFAGMVTAELDLIAAGEAQMSLPWDKLVQVLRKHSLPRTLLLHAVFLGALYLGSQPSEGSNGKDQVLGKCYGWRTLGKWTPEAADDGYLDFWWFWAAWLLLLACKEIKWLKRGLEAGFSQYLGRISFALYLLHGLVLRFFLAGLYYLAGVKKPQDGDTWASLWLQWYDASWFPFTNHGPIGLEPNFLFCAAISITIFLYVAELGTKFLDAPSVRMSKWVYLRYFKSE